MKTFPPSLGVVVVSTASTAYVPLPWSNTVVNTSGETPAISKSLERIVFTTRINSVSREPRSRSMALFVSKLTPRGPGVNNFLSLWVSKSEWKTLNHSKRLTIPFMESERSNNWVTVLKKTCSQSNLFKCEIVVILSKTVNTKKKKFTYTLCLRTPTSMALKTYSWKQV